MRLNTLFLAFWMLSAPLFSMDLSISKNEANCFQDLPLDIQRKIFYTLFALTRNDFELLETITITFPLNNIAFFNNRPLLHVVSKELFNRKCYEPITVIDKITSSDVLEYFNKVSEECTKRGSFVFFKGLSSDGRIFLTHYQDSRGKEQKLQVQDTESKTLLKELRVPSHSTIHRCRLNRDGRYILLAWSISFPLDTLTQYGLVHQIPGGIFRIPGSWFYPQIVLWNTETETFRVLLEGESVEGFMSQEENYTSCLLSKDGTKALISTDQFVKIWDTPTGKELFSRDQNKYSFIALSNEGSKALAVNESVIVMIHFKTGLELYLKRIYNDAIPLSIDPEGQSALITSNEGLFLWDFESGKKTYLKLSEGENVKPLGGWSDDGTTILAINYEDSAPIQNFPVHEEIFSSELITFQPSRWIPSAKVVIFKKKQPIDYLINEKKISLLLVPFEEHVSKNVS